MLRPLGTGLALSIVTLGLAACASPSGPPLELAAQVDLDRYLGRWYVVANIPYFLEKGEVGSYVEFSRRRDGDIKEAYFGHEKTFDAPLEEYDSHDYVVPGTNNARWRTSLFWPVYFSELILAIDPDYRYALIGYPGRGLGWVFARAPHIDDATYAALLSTMRGKGYDTSQFRLIPQSADQIGKPGYQ